MSRTMIGTALATTLAGMLMAGPALAQVENATVAFLMPRGRGVVVTPRPGVATRAIRCFGIAHDECLIVDSIAGVGRSVARGELEHHPEVGGVLDAEPGVRPAQRAVTLGGEPDIALLNLATVVLARRKQVRRT